MTFLDVEGRERSDKAEFFSFFGGMRANIGERARKHRFWVLFFHFRLNQW